MFCTCSDLSKIGWVDNGSTRYKPVILTGRPAKI